VFTVLIIPAVVLSTSNVLRIIFGLPFLLFLPGYALISVLFPRKTALGNIERIAYSIALSIVIVTLLGLLLNYIWSITVYPLVTGISVVTLGLIVATYFRRRNLPQEEINYLASRLNFGWQNIPVFEKVLYTLLVIGVVCAVSSSIVTFNKNITTYSELYILGSDGKADNYPVTMAVNQKVSVELIVASSEREDTSYKLKIVSVNSQILVDGNKPDNITFTLSDKQQKTLNVTFSFTQPGSAEKIEFDLYKDGSQDIYLSTYLKVNVTE
jgi:uncharacterized membrane protein